MAAPGRFARHGCGCCSSCGPEFLCPARLQDEDSAGQSNVFAVEPRTYVEGSDSDQTSVSLLPIAVAGAVAAAVVVFGLGLNGGSVDADVDYPGNTPSLSQLAERLN